MRVKKSRKKKKKMSLENGGNIFPLPLQFISGIAKAFSSFFSTTLSIYADRMGKKGGSRRDEERKKESMKACNCQLL